MKIATKAERLIEAVLILWFVVAMYFQQNVGLADNSDFTRAMGSVSSGPVGMPNWPAAHTEDWAKRFFNFWIPYWNLEFNLSIPRTSAALLWWPGALLNKYLYSSEILYLPSLSLFPKLILFIALLLLFRWTKFIARYRIVLLLGIGIPISLVLTNNDYVAYLNSFYQESASFVFLFLLLASILLLRRYRSLLYLLGSLMLVLLLAASKPAYIYWPLISVPFVFYAWYSKGTAKLRLVFIVLFSILLTVIFTFTSAVITRAGSLKINPYNSLFYGVLTVSDMPHVHLQHLGMDDEMIQCVNNPAPSSVGSACLAKYKDKMSFYNTASVIYREPLVMFKIMAHALENMQDVSLDYLGKYSFDDPRSKTNSRIPRTAGKRFKSSVVEALPLNLWTELKFNVFPTGYVLAFALIGFLLWFLFRLKQANFHGDLAFVGLLSTVACVIDMMVAVLGDGKYEIIKHLFLSNVLFDISFIVFLNSVLIYCIELVETVLKSNALKFMMT